MVTAQQLQSFADLRMRPRCEQIRNLLLAMQDDKAMIDDIYAALVGGQVFVDGRTDGPPHLLVSADILAFNSLISDLVTAISNNAQYAVATKSCVRPVMG